ncbi:MAG TPA: AI-2E family transporter, partial [Candidatus Acidoferrum sp.]
MTKTPFVATSTSDRLTTVLSYGALLLLGYLVFLIFAPFLVPLAWSAILAIFFYPLHQRLLRRFRPTPAAAISTLAVTLLLIAPALVVLVYATRQAIDASLRVQSTLLDPNQTVAMHAMNWFRSELPARWRSVDFSVPLRQAAERTAAFVAGRFGGLLKNLAMFFVDLFILIFALFFMFRDAASVERGARHLLPFDDEIQNDMAKESKELIFASVAIGLLVAGIHGVLGATAFLIAGVPSALFWGVL